MSRALVIDTVSGVIAKQLGGDPTMFGAEPVAGESLWALDADDGGYIDDEWIIVNGDGELELAGGAPGGITVPTVTLEFILEVEP